MVKKESRKEQGRIVEQTSTEENKKCVMETVKILY